jgi:hypothetical protein
VLQILCIVCKNLESRIDYVCMHVDQGCQIFPATTYPKGKIYQITLRYTQMP